MIAAKNITREDMGNAEDKRGREVQQVRLLREVVKELVEWDRVVLGGREGVLEEVEDGGEGEGEVRIVVTGPE